MQHFELPIFADDRAHAEKLARLKASEHYIVGHAKIMGGRVAEITGDLKRAGVTVDDGHTNESINGLVVGVLRDRLRACLSSALKDRTRAELLTWLNDPRDGGQTPPRITEAFAGIPYHPNAVTSEDIDEALKE